ncbi:OprO/OprP family phosphate-selective porin [Phenylobacterium sp.]|jgi:phosphate-selective porin OprO/OprP|uniref:OprO/OprP family phosphate-selective porin n=1 Tax=Phenylobacterium sp. TaxID=1871053 RepID=UPI0037838C9E
MQPSHSAAIACLALSLVPSAAGAQAMSTGGAPPAPISQEQFLSLMGRLDALEKRNTELQGEIQALKSAQPKPPGPMDAKATFNGGRPQLANAERTFTYQPRVQVQLDAAKYVQDTPRPLASDFRRGSYGDAGEAEHARDMSDGMNFRRVRLGAEGRFWTDWAYNLQLEFGGSGAEESGRIVNANISYTAIEDLELQIGAFAPTTSFNDATSGAAVLFAERPAPAEIVRGFTGADGRVGASALYSGKRWNVYAAVTGNLVQTATFDDQLGVIGRASFTPFQTKDSLVHVGVNTNIVLDPAAQSVHLNGADAVTPLRIRERPEMRVDGTRLIDTGVIDTKQLSMYGAEIGWRHKALSLAAEYFLFELDRRDALHDPSFSGWYVEGAFTLTGQPRRYDNGEGAFNQPRVQQPFDLKRHHLGVWEVAARWSDTDLNYRLGQGTALGAIHGGVQHILSLGLNWYPNDNVRFMAAWQHVDVDRISPGGNVFGAAPTPPAGAQIGQELDIWSLRTQYNF